MATESQPGASQSDTSITTANRSEGRAVALGFLSDIVVVALLLVLLVGAAWIRGATIWPEATGLDEAPYDDEGVYALAAQLVVQGKQPYRDFIYAHPPLGPIVLSPAPQYHFTAWGSPTSFMALRYLALVYSVLTVGLVFLIGWRLWGVAGGLFGSLLLAIDPQAVWAGRHVMLEAPLLCFGAFAMLTYILARELKQPPFVLLLITGFVAAVAGGIKVQGLVILLAIAIDLLLWRRWWALLQVFCGAVICWIPLWIYLLWLRQGDPLGQFFWLQVLRPADGLLGWQARLDAIWHDGQLLLALTPLALFSLPLIFSRSRRTTTTRRYRRTMRRVDLPRLPDLAGEDEGSAARPAPAEVVLRPPERPAGPPRGWTVIPIWMLLVAVILVFGRSYYAHYTFHLTVPLAILAGALPAAIIRALRGDWGRRAGALIVAGAAVVLVLAIAPPLIRDLFTPHQDRLYTIVSRYANNAVGPDAGIFAFDAQFTFRAARRPAREDHERFMVDSYGMLLYHGLKIDQGSLGTLIRRAFREDPGIDPYAVMWQPAAQEQLQASMARSDLVLVDQIGDGRLTASTRAWLRSHSQVAEQRERYVIYRIQR